MGISLGDVVRLRKKHACGGDQWRVLRLGIDIRIQCLKCGRMVLLERSTLERRIKASGLRAKSIKNPDFSDS